MKNLADLADMCPTMPVPIGVSKKISEILLYPPCPKLLIPTGLNKFYAVEGRRRKYKFNMDIYFYTLPEAEFALWHCRYQSRSR